MILINIRGSLNDYLKIHLNTNWGNQSDIIRPGKASYYYYRNPGQQQADVQICDVRNRGDTIFLMRVTAMMLETRYAADDLDLCLF